MIKKYLKYIIIFIGYLVFVLLPLTALTSLLSPYYNLFYILGSVGFFIILVIVTVNLIYKKASKKREINISKMRNDLILEKEKNSSDSMFYYNKLKSYNLFSWLYMTFIIGISVIFLINGIALYLEEKFPIIIILLFSYIHLALLNGLFSKDSKFDGFGIELKESDFPELYQIFKDAAMESGLQNFQIQGYISQDDNISINAKEGKCNLYINPVYLRLLKKSELFSVLMHEFAHVINGDTKENQKTSKIIMRWQKISNAMQIAWTPLFAFIEHHLFELYDKYLLLTNKKKEIDADELVKKKNRQVDYINACAKGKMYSLYKDFLSPYNFLESPDICDEVLEYDFNMFIKAFEKKKDVWIYSCKNELPSILSTHPTLPEKMENFGIKDFETEFFFSKEQSIKEVKKVFSLAHDMWGLNKEEWDEDRQTYYKPLTDKLKTGETNLESDAIDIADTYFQLCNYEEALNIYNKILFSHPNSSEALYRKGLILLNKFDNEGLDFVIKAIDKDIGFCEEGLIVIGSYLINMGLKEIKESLQEWFNQKVNDFFKVYPQLELSHRDKLYPCKLPPNIIDQIATKIKELNEVTGCYILTKAIKGSYDRNLIFLDFSRLYDKKIIEYNKMNTDFFKKLDLVIDDLNQTISLYDIGNLRKFYVRKIKRVKGSKIL